MAEEVDIIQHLLDVEGEATKLLLDAQQEADKRISAARAEADNRFKEAYGKITAELDAREAETRKRIDSQHTKAVTEYRDGLAGTEKDVPAFVALMDKLLYA